MQIDAFTLTALIVTPALVSLLLGVVGANLAKQIAHKGKVQVFFHDPDVNSWLETWQKLVGNEFTLGKGETGRKVILDGEARMNTPNGTWIVNPITGHNYKAELRGEFVKNNPGLNLRLLASNPESYHLQTVVNRQRAALNSNQKDDKWGWVPIAVIGVVFCLLIVMGTVGFIAWKISSSGAAPVGA